MNKNEKIKRYLFFFIGLFVSSLGVSLVTKAELGTSPISAIPYTLSLGFVPTLGQFTIIFSLILILLQLIILKKKFKKESLLQIPVSVAFGYFIDFTMWLLGFLHPTQYAVKLLFLLSGCIVLGIGVFIEVVADVVMLPGESFVKAISDTYHKEFGITKVAFDISMTVIAGVLSLILSKHIESIREGTVAAAILVGFIARFMAKNWGELEGILFGKDKQILDS